MHQRTGDNHGCVSYASVRHLWGHISGVLGYVSWIGKVAERNASLTEILLECGAVLYVRTNVPQTLMVRFTTCPSDFSLPGDADCRHQWPEAYNMVFGRTVNPANRTLTCGGSSGGEGALLRMGGSILGVGSDVGG